MNNTMNNAFIDDTFDNNEEEIVLDPPTELFEEANTIAQTNENDEKFEFILKYDVNQKDFLLSLLEALGISPSEIHENEDMTISINLNMSQLAFIKKMDFIEEVHSTIISNPYIFLEAEAASASDSTTVEIDHINEETLIPSPVSIENLNIETVPLITPTIDTTLTEDEVANNEVATMSVNNSRCSSCISNSTMGTAKQIITESFIIGCICCPETEEWFKFIAPKTEKYTIYTTGTLDTIGTIYNSSGTTIASNDDYVYNGNLNFRIICNLTAGETYYIKVRLNKKATGKYTIRVTKKILAKEVNINQPAISLMKGVTYELPTRPNYVYKGYNGAERIPDFYISITPSDTTEQLIYWYEEHFNNTVTCTVDRDDDGDLYYHLTALEIGTTKLYARDWNDNGKRDECTVMVVTPYEKHLQDLAGFSNEATALILKLYNKIDNIFTSENALQKAWRCARLLSEFSYNSFSFNDVAGSLTNPNNRKSYFMITLGYTENEYNTLSVALSDNHNDGNTIDFTHLQYSLAARLAYTLDKDGLASNLGSQFKTGNWGIYSDEDISYLGGWLGDATLRNDGGTGIPIMKNDDYMSDLDAENVYRLLLQGYTSIDAMNIYYSSMNASNTRANIFLQYIPYGTVKRKIFYELIDAQLYIFLSNASSQGDIIMTQYWSNLINNEEYHFNEIKSKYSDTYDFLMSLNNKLLTMAHYE